MSEKTIKIPGPDYPILIERNRRRVIVTLAGKVIADSRQALTLHEANHPPVQYIPREDVDMSAIERSNHGSYCPYTRAIAARPLSHISKTPVSGKVEVESYR